MDLSQLTKEQKQYILLGVIGVIAAGYGIFMGIGHLSSGASDKANELEDLSSKVDRAERELAGRAKTLKEFEQTVEALEGQLNYVPPEVNYYSWATEIVYARGREAGLEVESVDEVVGKPSKDAGRAEDDPVYFETYSLRVTAHGGFEQIKSFLGDVEEHHPLVRFSGVEISTSRNPEQHDVQLTLQWPFRLNRIAEIWQDRKPRPKREPEPRAEEPMPVIVKADPEPAPAPAPKPEPVRPAPAVVKAEPAPVRQPTPPAEPAPAAKPKPSRVVVKLPDAEPEPAPKPEPVKEPEPVKAVPVVAAAAPAPAAEPEPEPKKEEPPVIVKAPEPAPEPVVVKAPEPEPVREPEPEPVVVKAPEPVIAAAPVPESEPVRPEPVVVKAPEPEPVKEPEPVVAAAPVKEPEPAAAAAPAEPQPERVDESFADILASIDQMTADAEEKKAQEKNPEQEEMASLLASLGSRDAAQESLPAETASPAPAAAEDDLEAYVKQLAMQQAQQPAPEPIEEPAAETVDEPAADEPVRYVSSSKSAKILEEMLTRHQPQTSKSLGSFLDGIVGDINDKN